MSGGGATRRVTLNGAPVETAAATLAALLSEQGYDGMTVATALNGAFAPAARRAETPLADGDAVDVVAPRQGG